MQKADVELRIVRNQRTVPGEFEKFLHGFALGRGVEDVAVRDAGELRDVGWDVPLRVHEGLEARQDLAALHDDRADLSHAVVIRGKAGRLGVEGAEFLIEGAVRLAVENELVVDVVEVVALDAVDDLDAGLLARVPHLRERLRDAVIGDRDGPVAPLRRALDRVRRVREGVERRIAGVEVELDALFPLRGLVLARRLLRKLDAFRLDNDVLVVTVVGADAVDREVHALFDARKGLLVLRLFEVAGHADGTGVVGHFDAEDPRAGLLDVAVFDHVDLAAHDDGAGLGGKLAHFDDLAANPLAVDQVARDGGLLRDRRGGGAGVLLFRLRGGRGPPALVVDDDACEPVLRGDAALDRVALGGNGRAAELGVDGHRQLFFIDGCEHDRGVPQAAAHIMIVLAEREHF